MAGGGWQQSVIQPAYHRHAHFQGFSSDLATGVLFSGNPAEPEVPPLTADAPAGGYSVLYARNDFGEADGVEEDLYHPLFTSSVAFDRTATEFGVNRMSRIRVRMGIRLYLPAAPRTLESCSSRRTTISRQRTIRCGRGWMNGSRAKSKTSRLRMAMAKVMIISRSLLVASRVLWMCCRTVKLLTQRSALSRAEPAKAYMLSRAAYCPVSGASGEGALPVEALGMVNLYLLPHGGAPVFIATLPDMDGNEVRPFAGIASEGITAGYEYGDWQPGLGHLTASVTADGNVVFMSAQPLPVVGFPTGYPNNGAEEVYVFQSSVNRLFCASCNPTGEADGGAFLPVSAVTSRMRVISRRRSCRSPSGTSSTNPAA